MLVNSITMNDIKKTYISSQIKAITPDMVNIEMDQLITIGKNAHTISPRSRIGNNIVDFFTFKQRLETKGKYNTNFLNF